MIYETADDWRHATNKRVLFFAMSGLGKTHVSKMLARSGDWFHYSVDYRIGTRHLAEPIADNLKRHAMKEPFLREMLLKDAIHISANIRDDDLSALSAYLGKPGDVEKGGLPISEYKRRQDQFKAAEIQTLLDTPVFAERAREIYRYPHFICDTGGSICEWVDPDNPNDPVLRILSESCLMIWIKGSDTHTAELVKRFDNAPKPMAYQPEFLEKAWTTYLRENEVQPDQVDPNAFIRWTYAQALDHRQPRYEAMAKNWGITVDASDLAVVKDAAGFETLIADLLPQ